MISVGLQQSPSQRQVQTLAPQLRQGLDLLQAPAVSLRALIRQEAERNPLLDVEEPEAPSIDAMRENGDGSGTSPDSDPFDPSAADDGPDARDPALGDFSTLGDDAADDLFANSGEGEFDPDAQERRQFMLDSIPAAESLQEHLLRQLEESGLSGRVRAVAEQIVGSLDDGGYLRTPLAEAAQAALATQEEAQTALEAVQGFTPTGVGARDLRECLLLQLRADLDAPGAVDAARVCESAEAFEALAAHKFGRAERLASLGEGRGPAVLATLASLDPFPGRRYSSERVTWVKPEIFVRKDPKTGRWVASVDTGDVPRVSIAKRWRRRQGALRAAPVGAPESAAAREARLSERRWLDAMLRSGDMLLYNLEQRNATLQAVSQAVVDAQTAFFERGPDALRPLAMAEIAEALGVNESTVSRAVAGKWMRSPRGLHELRGFFGGGVRTETGEDASVQLVKKRIREMVAAEDASAPLSDLAIAARLERDGVKLARRTVAKYREALKIPSSSMRRK